MGAYLASTCDYRSVFAARPFLRYGRKIDWRIISGDISQFEDKTAAIAEDAMARFEETDEDMVRPPEPATMYA